MAADNLFCYPQWDIGLDFLAWNNWRLQRNCQNQLQHILIISLFDTIVPYRENPFSENLLIFDNHLIAMQAQD